MSQRLVFICLCAAVFGGPVLAQFNVPDVLVDTLHPKGFRVSIADEPGIKLFAFHGKLNEEFEGREAGRYSADILKAKNDRWTFTDHTTWLNPGDKIYFWVNVDYDDGAGRRGYIKDDLVFVVPEVASVESGTTTKKPKKDKDKDKPNKNNGNQQTNRPPTQPTRATPAPTCRQTATFVNGRRSCKGKLIFEENFATLSTSKWTPEVKFGQDPDYEFTIYQNNRDNVFVDENHLFIKPELTEDKYGVGFVSRPEPFHLGDQCTGVPESLDCVQKPKAWSILPPVISSQISTKGHFSFIYGVVEIRAKLPQGDWLYPELYLRPTTESYGEGLDSGLIKIAFTPGNVQYSKKLQGGCVLGQSVAARNFAFKNIRSENSWTDEFHVFRVEWKTDSISLSVDGHVYANIFPPDEGFASEESSLELEPATAERWRGGTLLAPFDKEMYITVGVGAGGLCFPDKSDGSKPWNNDDPKAQLNFYKAQSNWSATWGESSQLIVDYIRVWAL